MAAEVDAQRAGAGELVAEDAYLFPDVRIDKKFVIQQQGRDFVLSDGLLDGLHQLSGGFFDVETRIEQLPTGENGQTCVVSATVTVFHPEEGRVLRRASDLGDASPASVSRTILPHLIRMASTRAVSRALRNLLNVGAVAFEELGQGGAEPAADERTPAPAEKAPARPATAEPAPRHVMTEHVLIAGKPYTRGEVLATYYKRLEQARANGLALGELDAVPPEQAPLATLVAKSQEIRRRLETRASAK